MNQLNSFIFICLILILNKVDCSHLHNDLVHPFYSNYLDYEKGLIYKSLRQLQDSVSLVNSNLFNNQANSQANNHENSQLNSPLNNPINNAINKHLFNNLYSNNNLFNRRFDFKQKRFPTLQIIQQLNKEIIKNQLISYEKFFSKLKRYDSVDPMESRQAMNLIKTLFRFPVLLLFSNIFQLPLLPTLILASPFLNQEGTHSPANLLSSTLTSSLTNSLLNSASSSSAAASGALASSAATANSAPLQASSSNQIATHLPFSLNPLMPINQLLNNFISEIIGDLQNMPVLNNLMQGFSQVLTKPNVNRITQFQQPQSNQAAINQNVTKKLINESIASNSLPMNTPAEELISANASTFSMAYQEPSAPLPNTPLIGPVPDLDNPGGNSILNTLANSLLESNKNYQLTETLGVNNGGSITDLAMNAVNTLATMLKIKKQKKDLNSNEEMILDFLTDKNYLQQVTSIGNLLKMGLKQKMEKEMNVCLVRTICESNQKQISFAFDQIFSLAMHLTGMETRMEHSPWHAYYRVGRKMINEKNICKLIPKCRDEQEEGKSVIEKKLNLLEKIDKLKKLDKLFSRKASANHLPDYQKPFRVMKKARKMQFAKRLFNRSFNKSFRKMNKLTRRMTRFVF